MPSRIMTILRAIPLNYNSNMENILRRKALMGKKGGGIKIHQLITDVYGNTPKISSYNEGESVIYTVVDRIYPIVQMPAIVGHTYICAVSVISNKDFDAKFGYGTKVLGIYQTGDTYTSPVKAIIANTPTILYVYVPQKKTDSMSWQAGVQFSAYESPGAPIEFGYNWRMIFDLTADFGEGNEPTAEEFLAMIGNEYLSYGEHIIGG